MEKVEVNREALRQVLKALMGPGHLIRELLVIHDLGCKGLIGDHSSNPIGTLITEYNQQVEVHNCAQGEKDARKAENECRKEEGEALLQKYMNLVDEKNELKVQNHRLRKDAEQGVTLLKVFMFCQQEAISREEIDAGKELIQKYTTMKDFSTT